MIETLKTLIQYIAISSFALLTVIGIIQRDWNFGVGLNSSLTLLYVFLYLHPIK